MKKIMVDLDDTLVSYSEMFINRANSIIGSKQEFPDLKLSADDIQDYDYEVLFNKVIPTTEFWYSPKSLMNMVTKSIYSDELFYLNPVYTKEAKTIFKMIIDKRVSEDCFFELNTKVSTTTMVIAKAKLFDKDKRFDYFNNIIIDLDHNSVHSGKRTDYDMIIDDSPYIIKNYLEKNPNGKVLMPLRNWNKCLVGTPRVEVLEVNKE